MKTKAGSTSQAQDNKQKTPQPKSLFSNIFFYIFLIFGIYLVSGYFLQSNISTQKKPISEIVTLIREERVQKITVSDNTIKTQLKDGTALSSEKETNISFEEILTNNNIDQTKIPDGITIEHKFTWDQILSAVLTFGLPALFIFLIVKQMRGTNNSILSFGKARAKLFAKEGTIVTFADVAGNEEAKTEMMEIVDFLKNPDKYRKVGARIPKGVLLVGPSGVGKTLLAKAIAGEAEVPFFSVAGSEFMEMLVGVGSARARDLFQTAKANQPSLIFIDEVDAIGRQRGMGIGGGHDEREQTLNQILIEMDGFDPRTSVIVLAATNRPDMLDPALIRAGRFDRRITIPLPDLKDREGIIKIHMQGKPFTKDVNIEKIARKTVGFSGADIENMLNESAILAARNNRTKIIPTDIEEAALKVTMGSERKTLQTEEERKMTAVHEAGHAIVAAKLPEMDPVQRISIVARGASLGHTSFPPERDRYNETKTRLDSIIATMLGGRAAEDIVFGELTVGATDDIKRATKLARKMVMEYGMSNLGPIAYETEEDNIWLARQIGDNIHYSDKKAAEIDEEIKKLIETCFERAKKLIEENKEALNNVAKKLLEKETIDGEEFLSLFS